jgi:hypothetical protein
MRFEVLSNQEDNGPTLVLNTLRLIENGGRWTEVSEGTGLGRGSQWEMARKRRGVGYFWVRQEKKSIRKVEMHLKCMGRTQKSVQKGSRSLLLHVLSLLCAWWNA